MNDFFILLPPSEGKKEGGLGSPLSKVPTEVLQIINKLNKTSDKDWKKLLGVKGENLEQAIQSNKSILSSKTMPAIDRYTGVVYSAIDYSSFNQKEQIFFADHVRIVSAVFGLVKPTDLIPEYKLKIDKLGADKYWKPIMKEKLKGVFVIELLPQAHKKAVEYDDGISVDFHFIKGGKKIPAGHNGKHIKGRFVRWLCQNQICDVKQFKNFKEDGFRWENGIFIKNL